MPCVMKYFVLFILAILLFSSCNDDKLPVYGIKTLSTKQVDGKDVTDSIDYVIPTFSLTDQDARVINSATVKGKVHVADFFFTSCPSICPPMKKQMLRIYDKYQNNDDVVLLSYSIDPKRDSVEKLHSYGPCSHPGIVRSVAFFDR